MFQNTCCPYFVPEACVIFVMADVMTKTICLIFTFQTFWCVKICSELKRPQRWAQWQSQFAKVINEPSLQQRNGFSAFDAGSAGSAAGGFNRTADRTHAVPRFHTARPVSRHIALIYNCIGHGYLLRIIAFDPSTAACRACSGRNGRVEFASNLC